MRMQNSCEIFGLNRLIDCIPLEQEFDMHNAIEYFDQYTPGMIIAAKKDGADELGVYYSGSLQQLEILRDLINLSIEELRENTRDRQSA